MASQGGMLGGRGKSALAGNGYLNDLSGLGTGQEWGEKPVPPPQLGMKTKMSNVSVPESLPAVASVLL